MPLTINQLLLLSALPHVLAGALSDELDERAQGPSEPGRGRRVNAQPVTRAVTRMSACAHCGARYSPASRHQKYCGSRCRQRAYNERRRGALAEHTAPASTSLAAASCAHCGAFFSPTSSRQIHCGASCRVLSSRARRLAAEPALAGLWGIEPAAAGELIESRGLRWAAGLLAAAGLVYLPQARCYVGSMSIELAIFAQQPA